MRCEIRHRFPIWGDFHADPVLKPTVTTHFIWVTLITKERLFTSSSWRLSFNQFEIHFYGQKRWTPDQMETPTDKFSCSNLGDEVINSENGFLATANFKILFNFLPNVAENDKELNQLPIRVCFQHLPEASLVSWDWIYSLLTHKLIDPRNFKNKNYSCLISSNDCCLPM